MSKGFFGTFLDGVKSEAIVLEGDVVADLKLIKDDAVVALDNLFGRLVPVAMKGAAQIEEAVKNGSILQSEKRSSLVTVLEQEAQGAGHDLAQHGVSATVNLAVEFGVNLFKMVIGQSVSTPTPTAAA